MRVVRPMLPRACVRCGRRPRSRALFLCDPCQADPRALAEAREIARATEGYLAQRRVAIERFGWVGRW